MARRAGAQRRQMPDRKVWPGAGDRRQRPACARGWGMASNPGTELFCFDARPHLFPLPRGEDFTNHAFGGSKYCPNNPALGFSKEAGNVIALSLKSLARGNGRGWPQAG